MNCPICFEENDMYTIACGSNTPHQICNTCEIAMRCLAKPTNRGRFITCPMCRAVETVQGTRTLQSYEAELLPELLRYYADTDPDPIRIIGDYIHVNLGYRVLTALTSLLPIQVIHMIQGMNLEQHQELAQSLAREINQINPTPTPPTPTPTPETPTPTPTPTPETPTPETPTPTPRIWCQSGRRNIGLCTTKSKTTRLCSFLSCTNKVCRKCKQCTHH